MLHRFWDDSGNSCIKYDPQLHVHPSFASHSDLICSTVRLSVITTRPRPSHLHPTLAASLKLVGIHSSQRRMSSTDAALQESLSKKIMRTLCLITRAVRVKTSAKSWMHSSPVEGDSECMDHEQGT